MAALAFAVTLLNRSESIRVRSVVGLPIIIVLVTALPPAHWGRQARAPACEGTTGGPGPPAGPLRRRAAARPRRQCGSDARRGLPGASEGDATVPR
jgi:hypothetical protein